MARGSSAETLRNGQRGRKVYYRFDSTRSDCYIDTQSEKFTWYSGLQRRRTTVLLSLAGRKKCARGEGSCLCLSCWITARFWTWKELLVAWERDRRKGKEREKRGANFCPIPLLQRLPRNFILMQFRDRSLQRFLRVLAPR